MKQSSLISGQWPAFLSALPPTLDLDASARAFKALLRRRGVRDGASLLRLALAYGPCGMSLRGNAAWAEAGEIAILANTSLLERLRKSTDWLGEIVRHLLMARVSSAVPRAGGRIVTLSDGTSLSEPGSTGTDWRLHVVFDLGSCSLRHVEVTDAKGAETLRRGVPEPGEIRIADRGYAKAKDLRDLVEHGADFVVRAGWRSLKMLNPEGSAFDLFAALARVPRGKPADLAVRIEGGKGQAALPARLIVIRKPEEATEHERGRIERTAARKQRNFDPRSLVAAEYMMIVTSLNKDEFSAEQIADLYSLRWQIELAFKRLKSLLHIDQLPAFDPRLAKTWIYAHLIAALVLDRMTQDFLESPP